MAPIPPQSPAARPSRASAGGLSIRVKLSILLLFVALLPMGVTAVYNLARGLTSVEAMEYKNLELLAADAADRVDQLIGDTRGTIAEVATDFEVSTYLGASAAEHGAVEASARRTLENVVASNPDVFSVFLLDTTGRCALSTNPDNLHLDLSFREYFKDAVLGETHVSELLSGSTSGRPGVYFSQKVRGPRGEVAGVAVLKLHGDTLSSVVRSLRNRSGREAMLVDRFGVVFAASDPAVQYRSLGPLGADVLASATFDRRFSSAGVDVIHSLDVDALAAVVPGASGAGHVSYLTAAEGRKIAGFAPVRSKQWVMVVTELDAEFTAPLRRLARHTVQSAVVVGAFVTALALLLAGGIVRPLRALIDSARSVERGGFEPARVDERRGDEIGLLGRAFNLMVDGLRARSRELEVFGRLVSPEVRERLLDGGLGLEGEMRHVAVLFSDIRGFSTMSETMPPQAVVAMLNEYMAAMTRAVREWRGYVNNFIGDAIVVVFGAPTGHDDVERRAARAALAMRDALAELNAVRVARGEAPLATGTGIGAGEVVAGQIGSPERAVYTVIGDVVNVASRLESLTKEKPGHPILVTRAVADAIAGDADLVAKPLGSEKVKGRSVPVELFALHRVKEEGGVRA